MKTVAAIYLIFLDQLDFNLRSETIAKFAFNTYHCQAVSVF